MHSAPSLQQAEARTACALFLSQHLDFDPVTQECSQLYGSTGGCVYSQPSGEGVGGRWGRGGPRLRRGQLLEGSVSVGDQVLHAAVQGQRTVAVVQVFKEACKQINQNCIHRKRYDGKKMEPSRLCASIYLSSFTDYNTNNNKEPREYGTHHEDCAFPFHPFSFFIQH